MSQEDIKESPLDKAKRLKAEKELKDQAKAEDETKKQAEVQARTEKLGALNNSKQDLEKQLEEINLKIDVSRNEAHETRDTMKDGGLDQDEEFKDEYNSTVSEVAGNLNELRNERNRVKAELEQINFNIENFDVNETIAEGKEITQGAVETVERENKEAIAQVENYPGAETGDIKIAEKITAETSKEVNQAVENADKEIKEVVDGDVVENISSKDEKKEFLINVEELKDRIQASREKMLATGAHTLNTEEEIKLYSSLGKPEELKKAQEQAANYYEKQLSAYGWAGDKYRDSGDIKKAEEMYRKGIVENEAKLKMDVNKVTFVTVNICARTAEMYEKLGDSEKSREMYKNLIETAEKISPRDSQGYKEVAIAYEKLGDSEKSKEMWEKDASMWGESKAHQAAASYEKAGNKEKAKEFYEKAIAYQEKREEPDSEILAEAYVGIGQKGKAIEILNNTIKKLEKRGATNGSFHLYEVMSKYL
jgi:tetratricopeptide (TPR) repeat protein